MRRLRLLIGAFLVGLSTVAIVVGLRRGLTPLNAVVTAFFLATIYAGWQLLRGNWKNEREHEAKLTRLIDESSRAGGADPPEQPGK